jgi:hypothetical protein
VATLTIKNDSDAPLEFTTPGGAVSIAPGKSEDLTEKKLKSPVLADALLSGDASIVPIADPTKEGKSDLARAVLPAIVAGTGAKLAKLKTRFDQSQKELIKLRESFNKTRKQVEASLDEAQGSLSGWPGVRKAVKNLILDAEAEDPAVKEKKDALAALEAELKALKSEDLAATGRSLEDWYKDRVAKEQAVKDAAAALAKIAKEKANPLAGQLDALDVGVAGVQAIVKSKVIGKEIPEFG